MNRIFLLPSNTTVRQRVGFSHFGCNTTAYTVGFTQTEQRSRARTWLSFLMATNNSTRWIKIETFLLLPRRIPQSSYQSCSEFVQQWMTSVGVSELVLCNEDECTESRENESDPTAVEVVSLFLNSQSQCRKLKVRWVDIHRVLMNCRKQPAV